jgi:predicted nucleic acid-binding protein
MHSKHSVRKFLQKYPVIEFDAKAAHTANKLAVQYRVGAKQSKDFLIAAIAIANKIPILTENTKDFDYKELGVVGYKIV